MSRLDAVDALVRQGVSARALDARVWRLDWLEAAAAAADTEDSEGKRATIAGPSALPEGALSRVVVVRGPLEAIGVHWYAVRKTPALAKETLYYCVGPEGVDVVASFGKFMDDVLSKGRPGGSPLRVDIAGGGREGESLWKAVRLVTSGATPVQNLLPPEDEPSWGQWLLMDADRMLVERRPAPVPIVRAGPSNTHLLGDAKIIVEGKERLAREEADRRGISYRLVQERIRNGKSLEEACTVAVRPMLTRTHKRVVHGRRQSVAVLNGETVLLRDAVAAVGASPGAVYAALRDGRSSQHALAAAATGPRPSGHAQIDANREVVKGAMLDARLARAEEARKAAPKTPTEREQVAASSLDAAALELAEANGVSPRTLRRRIEGGMPVEEAATTPPGKNGPRPAVIEVDGQVRQVREVAKETGITMSAYYQRIGKGMPPAEAATLPPGQRWKRQTVLDPAADVEVSVEEAAPAACLILQPFLDGAQAKRLSGPERVVILESPTEIFPYHVLHSQERSRFVTLSTSGQDREKEVRDMVARFGKDEVEFVVATSGTREGAAIGGRDVRCIEEMGRPVERRSPMFPGTWAQSLARAAKIAVGRDSEKDRSQDKPRTPDKGRGPELSR